VEKNRESLAKLINQFCFDVNIIDKVESIAIAKESINKNNPQLIFLDIEMPGGDGFKLLQDIDQPQFEVIFTTAHANYAIKAIKFAALDYLLKPINVNELKVAVEKAVDKIDKSDRSRISLIRALRFFPLVLIFPRYSLKNWGYSLPSILFIII